jgi:hypothetical protein
MNRKNSVPGSLRAFLKDGVEAAECSICAQPFDSMHIVIQIKQCGHHFGKDCLERWLKQKDSRGTCPTCRGVLFVKKAKVRGDSSIPAPLPAIRAQPLTLARFNNYYQQPGNIELSNRGGFLGQIWTIIQPGTDGATSQLAIIKAAIVRAFDAGNDFSTDERTPERDMLAPYIQRLRSRNTNLACPIMGLVQTISKLFTFCSPGFFPADSVWRVILLFQAQSSDTPPELTWPLLRDAAWTLHDHHLNGQVSREQWRALYLFLWLMAMYRAQRLGSSSWFKIDEVCSLLRTLDFGYPNAGGDTRDTNTRVFLSAAVHVLEQSGIDTACSQPDRSRRLLSGSTGVAQLKADVEGLWLEGIAIGARDVAAGYPEHWWTGT